VNTATVRQQRLGAELRKLRERAGLSTRAAGQKLGVDPARISNIEAGRFGVSADRIRAFALGYDCGDEPYVEALAAMTTGRTPGWTRCSSTRNTVPNSCTPRHSW
jgi:transcriptional regulator with XRE-family HTH domain